MGGTRTGAQNNAPWTPSQPRIDSGPQWKPPASNPYLEAVRPQQNMRPMWQAVPQAPQAPQQGIQQQIAAAWHGGPDQQQNIRSAWRGLFGKR